MKKIVVIRAILFISLASYSAQAQHLIVPESAKKVVSLFTLPGESIHWDSTNMNHIKQYTGYWSDSVHDETATFDTNWIYKGSIVVVQNDFMDWLGESVNYYVVTHFKRNYHIIGARIIRDASGKIMSMEVSVGKKKSHYFYTVTFDESGKVISAPQKLAKPIYDF